MLFEGRDSIEEDNLSTTEHRKSGWTQLGSTYTISGLQAGQTATLGLRLNGSSLSVEIDGVTRITAASYTNDFAIFSSSVKFICIEWNF